MVVECQPWDWQAVGWHSVFGDIIGGFTEDKFCILCDLTDTLTLTLTCEVLRVRLCGKRYRDIRGTHNHRLEERGSHYNTQCSSPILHSCRQEHKKRSDTAGDPPNFMPHICLAAKANIAHALVDPGCHLFSHSWLLLIIWKWKLCPPFLVLMGLSIFVLCKSESQSFDT